jgi:hypothetical protein
MIDLFDLLDVLALYFRGELDEVEDLNRLMYTTVENLCPDNTLRGQVDRDMVSQALEHLTPSAIEDLKTFIRQESGYDPNGIQQTFHSVSEKLSSLL